MTRPRLARAVVALACATVAFEVTAAARAPRARFMLGVLRRDGIVIPFATFDGKDWRTDWPAPKDHVDVPINIASVPKDWWRKLGPRAEWQAWIGAEPPRVLHVTQPDWFPAQCLRQIGLRTAYMLPLGVVRADGRLFWIAQWSGWDYERYEIVEIKAKNAEPVLAAFGGSC